MQFTLDQFQYRGRSRAAKLRLKLHTIPVERIVTGSDHDAARRTEFLDVVRNGGSGCVVVGKKHRNAGASKHLCDHAGETVGSKARVIADDDASRCIFMLEDVSCDRACDPPYVVESEVVGNEAAPAVGAEFDFSHGVGSRWSAVASC